MRTNHIYITAAVFAIFLLVPLINQVGAVQSISLVKSGLIASDPLNNETKTQQQLQQNPRYWFYNGDAIALNAKYTFFKDTQGLHIGTQAPTNGTYAGFYAETPNTNAILYHTLISQQVRSIPSNNNFFFNGIYVQTQQPLINYISCVTNTGKLGTSWLVGHTYGSPGQALVFDTLWVDTSPNQPLTRDCTIITNGQNYLKVYLDGKMVYTSNILVLGMPAPFNLYLEPQNSYAGQMLNGTYNDFYMTANETIQVTNIPSNAATVTVTDSTGKVLASSPVSGNTGTVDVGMYHFPLSATINIYNSANVLLASGPASIYGGDAYTVNAPVSTVPQPPTGLTATAVSSSQINLSWTAPSNNGGSAITGYKIERSLNAGTTWSTVVSNTGTTATTYSDTGLSSNTTYTYRVSAINGIGTSSPSNTASATTSPPPTAPGAPTGLSATASSSSQINLAWTVPASNGGSSITGYKIERSLNAGTTWSTVVSNTGTTATTYSDTGLTPNTTYTYRVSAINAIGTSSPSNTASATTSPLPTGIILNGVQSTSGSVMLPPFQITLANFNAGTGSNRLLVVGVDANNNNVASITFGGVQLTQAVQSYFNNDAEFWYLTNPNGTGNIVVTMNGPTSVVVGAYSFAGVNQASPLPTSVTNHNIAASSPTISLTTKFQNSWVLDLPAIYGGVTLGSPTCTQQWDINMPSAITGASSSTIQASLNSVTCKWTASSGDLWDDVAIEVRAN